MTIGRQKGVYLPWLMLSVGLCLLVGYFVGFLAAYVPIDKPVVPALLTAVLVAPSALVIQLISKLNSIKKIKGLSFSEKRRLDHIVHVKVVRLYWLAFLYLIAVVCTGMMFFIGTLEVPFNGPLWALRTTGFMASAGILTSMMVSFETTKIENYEAGVARRSDERKERAALLKKMMPKKEKAQ